MAEEYSRAMINPEDVPDIISRRRWIILLPLFIALVLGIYLALTLPKIYQTSTLIIIQPQSVPRDYVRSVVSDDAESRLSTISQQILSRTNLEKIIAQFNLFSEPNYAGMFMEDKLESLRNRIKIRVTRDRRGADAFSISFRDSNPNKMAHVTNALANSFINTNLKVREDQATDTSEFLNTELENIRERMQQTEDNLKEYRQRYMGELPEQLNSNLSALNRLQEQLNAKEDSLRDTKISLSLVEKQAAETSQTFDPNNSDEERNMSDYLSSDNIYLLRKQLSDMLTRYTEQHPDVTRLKKRIAELERQGVGGKDSDAIVSADPFQAQKRELLRDKYNLEQEIAEIKQQLQVYQQRVENTPKREQELVSLRRDYSNLNDIYNSLLNRKLEAELSLSMERKQKGEQFQIVDRAKRPEKPIEPDLKRLFLLIVAGGLGIGCGLAYALEYLDTTFRKVDDIETYLKIPVIATIPPVFTKAEIRKKRALSALSFLFAGVVTVTLCGYAFVTLKGTDYTLEIIKRYINI